MMYGTQLLGGVQGMGVYVAVGGNIAIGVNVFVGEGKTVRVGEGRDVTGAEVAIIVFVGAEVAVLYTIAVGFSAVIPARSVWVQSQPPKIKNIAIRNTAIKLQKMAGFIGSRGVLGFLATVGF